MSTSADEAKQISLKYQRKREVLFAAVDSNNWSTTAEISCDDVGTLIRVHRCIPKTCQSDLWNGSQTNFNSIEYIENKDEEKFRIFFDIDRDNVMKSLESSLLDYVNDDVPFDFLLQSWKKYTLTGL